MEIKKSKKKLVIAIMVMSIVCLFTLFSSALQNTLLREEM